jgi:hypothetical protein
MQLPLNVVQQFGRFTYQDEQQGIEVITAIQDFLEEYQGESNYNLDSEAKVVTIRRDQAGIVTVKKSVKLLPNMQINLKALIENTQKHLDLKEATNLAAIFSELLSSNWITKVVTALRFIQFAINLATVELTEEQAGVLVALHHLCRGELQLEISLSELQAKIQANHHFSLSVEKLDEILKELKKLRCISRRKDHIYLTEKIILKDD